MATDWDASGTLAGNSDTNESEISLFVIELVIDSHANDAGERLSTASKGRNN